MATTRGGGGTKTAGKGGLPWPVIALALAALAGVLWLSVRAGGGGGQSEKPSVCTQCNHQGMVKVCDAPGQDPWPQECPKCHTKHLYMSATCPNCRKPIPQKDPNGEGFGQPTVCPTCRHTRPNT